MFQRQNRNTYKGYQLTTCVGVDAQIYQKGHYLLCHCIILLLCGMLALYFFQLQLIWVIKKEAFVMEIMTFK